MSDNEKFTKILTQVRALIAKADSTEFQGESDLLRAKAEALMLKYRIEEALVFEQAIGHAAPLTPVWSTVRLGEASSEYTTNYSQIAGAIITHVGAKGLVKTDWEQSAYLLEMCGFDTDLRYAEVLLTSCLLEFGKRLEPRYDHDLSQAENAWIFRSAGWERKRIARLMFGDWTTVNEMKAKNRKVTRLIKEWGDKTGQDSAALLGRGNMMSTYRDSYVSGFVGALNLRLWNMRNEAQTLTGGALVPVSRMEAVEEAYYGKYPQYRPKDPSEYRSPRQDCEKCQRAKSGYCRDHSFLRPISMRARSINTRAQSAGRTAAYSVNLGRNDGAGRGIEN